MIVNDYILFIFKILSSF